MTFTRYRMMDLCIFTALLCICEAMIVKASVIWFPQEAYIISLTPAIVSVVMVRWGAYAAIPAAVGGAVLCLCSGARPLQYLVYCAGNLLALALLPALKKWTWRALHEHVLLVMAYGMLSALLMQAGRAVIAGLGGMAFGVITGFFTTDILSLLFCVLVVWICRRLDGMLEEQRHYVKRIREEMLRSGGMHE